MLGSALAHSVMAAPITLDPNSYPSGTILTHVIPQVSLSVTNADFQTLSGVDVEALTDLDDYAPVGTEVFGFGSNVSWNSNDRLKCTFPNPVAAVSIDFGGAGGDDAGELDVFSSSGELLASSTTPLLAAGTYQTMTIKRPSADISYAIAYSIYQDSDARLDYLQFSLASPMPVITSALSVTGTSGLPFRYQITASNGPTSFNATPLPKGLSVNTSTGLIAGRPDVSGTFLAGISATNAGGTDSETLTLIVAVGPPAITSPLTALATNGLAFNYQITASNAPFGFNATGLPAGLSVNTSTGLISGAATMNGKFSVTLSATNAEGTGLAPLALTADFNGIKGSYTGLATTGGTTVGLFTLSLTANGDFTGKLTLAGAHYRLKGAFSSDDTFSGTLTAGATTLDVILSVDPSLPGVSGAITVNAPGGITSYSIESGILGVFKASTIPAGLAGRYTVIIPGVSGTDPALPHAPGFGTMNVTTKGAINIAGTLGDGTRFSAGGHLQSGGETWTLFTPLYAGKSPGSIAGTMTFETTADSDCDGMLDWTKPAQAGGILYPGGFSVSVDLLAAKYASPPLPPGPATFTLGGGNLPDSAISDTLAISSKGKVTVSGGNNGGVTLILAASPGKFSGKFLYPGTNKETSFDGVIYQKPVPAGFGLFLGTDQCGSLQITQ